MSAKELLQISYFCQGVLCLGVLLTMILRRVTRVFPQLGLLLAVELATVVISVVLLFHRSATHLDVLSAYRVYFDSYWVSSLLEFGLQVAVTYSVFAEAMRPLSGLHSAGKVVFRWVGVVSCLVVFGLVASPNLFASKEAFADVVGRLQQGAGVLTLCLLVFVCFAVRPLGLTFRSHIFGVSLGLGVMAAVGLVQAAWLNTNSGHSVYSPIYLTSGIGTCVALCVWGFYFAMPEPERRMILLPTTSPFFFWNRISEILGDAPGQVAIAGFKPDMLAPAEIEMLTAATSREAAAANSRPDVRSRTSAVPAHAGGSGLPVRSELPRRPRPALALSR